MTLKEKYRQAGEQLVKDYRAKIITKEEYHEKQDKQWGTYVKNKWLEKPTHPNRCIYAEYILEKAIESYATVRNQYIEGVIDKAAYDAGAMAAFTDNIGWGVNEGLCQSMTVAELIPWTSKLEDELKKIDMSKGLTEEIIHEICGAQIVILVEFKEYFWKEKLKDQIKGKKVEHRNISIS